MALSRAGLGRCTCCFWLAVAFDIFGLAVLLIGVFANVFFYDFLIYAGSIVIFLSLIWWVFWYTGNIEVPSEELADDIGLTKKNTGVMGLVRTLSGRVSSSFRRSRNARPAKQGRRESPGPKPKFDRPVTIPMAQTHTGVSGILYMDQKERPIHTSPI